MMMLCVESKGMTRRLTKKYKCKCKFTAMLHHFQLRLLSLLVGGLGTGGGLLGSSG